MTNEATLTLEFLDHAPSIAARELQQLPIESAAALVESVPTRLSAPVLNSMIPWHAANLLSAISAEKAAGILRNLSFADSISLTRLVVVERRSEIYDALPTKWARRLKNALDYPQHQVGAWIDPEVPILGVNDTVADALAAVTAAETASHLFVESEGHEKYVGIVAVRDIVRADRTAKLQQLPILRPEPVSNRATLSTLAFDGRWDECLYLPVVGRRGNLLGGLSRKTLRHAIHQAQHATDAKQQSSLLYQVIVAYGLTCLALIKVLLPRTEMPSVASAPSVSHEQ